MAIFQASPKPGNHSHFQRYLLLHNWRTAGSSTSSLLAANFHKQYLKVGLQYNGMGLPNGKAHQILTLGEVRSGMHQSLILGGHLFSGINAFLPGDWELWMTARNPIERARSGVLRFHGRPYAASRHSDVNLFSHEGSQKLETEEDLRRLFREHLRYERNGMCRRLGMLSLAPSFHVSDSDNLEKVNELSLEYSDQDLYDAAHSRLDSVRILILTQHYTLSVLCLERHLGTGALLNPFTNLHLNGRNQSHTLPEREALLQQSQHVLEEMQASDLRLWKELKQRFRAQVVEYQISKLELAAREALQSEPLFSPSWFTQENLQTREADLIKAMANQLAQRAAAHPELAELIIEQAGTWKRLTPSAAEKMVHLARKKLSSH